MCTHCKCMCANSRMPLSVREEVVAGCGGTGLWCQHLRGIAGSVKPAWSAERDPVSIRKRAEIWLSVNVLRRKHEDTGSDPWYPCKSGAQGHVHNAQHSVMEMEIGGPWSSLARWHRWVIQWETLKIMWRHRIHPPGQVKLQKGAGSSDTWL